ncbi:MAG TPA: hypothetical protein VK714_04350 [Myxococcota bacterium]|nr:hypothetical protein [Myxococcota bacterium]
MRSAIGASLHSVTSQPPLLSACADRGELSLTAYLLRELAGEAFALSAWCRAHNSRWLQDLTLTRQSHAVQQDRPDRH